MAEVRLGTLNKVLLIGRLTRDPESRYTPSGAAVLNFGIAVNRRFRDQSGEWRDDTCFVNCVAWQKLAERLAETLKKGSAVLVEGRLQSRSWETQDGQKRNTIEVNALSVQSLDKRGEGGFGGPSSMPEAPDGDDSPQDDDEIPF
jgi:single-strand DNA-binding protein